MRFWLRWAILTLPLAACLYLWGRSYLVDESVVREGNLNELVIVTQRGTVLIAFLRAKGWSLSGGHWTHTRRDYPVVDPSESSESSEALSHHFLGFGYEWSAGPGGATASMIAVPMWGPSVLFLLPPLWLYRRRRKGGKTGFPIEPVNAPVP